VPHSSSSSPSSSFVCPIQSILFPIPISSYAMQCMYLNDALPSRQFSMELCRKVKKKQRKKRILEIFCLEVSFVSRVHSL
jgi:hypothetical protein